MKFPFTMNSEVPFHLQNRFINEILSTTSKNKISGTEITYDEDHGKEAIWYMNYKLGWIDDTVDGTRFKEDYFVQTWHITRSGVYPISRKVMSVFEAPMLDLIRQAD